LRQSSAGRTAQLVKGPLIPLIPRAPFDFTQTLRFVGAFTPAAGEQTTHSETLCKAVMIQRTPVVFAVRSSGSIERPQLEYTLTTAAPITAEIERAALDRIRFYLSLDDDLQPFYATVRANDLAFQPIMQRLYGFHQVKFLTPFENACWAVLTQRTPVAAARNFKRALVARYGAALTVEGQEYWAFPAAETLAAAGRDDLAALLRHERKATYLHAVAEAFATVDEDWLRAGTYEQVREWLLAIDGIGTWSASFVLIRGLGRMDAIATPEHELLAAARSVYGPDMTSEALSHLAQQVYRENAGYWAFYLRNAGL
jgi:DNA-3-methyladenine glycosylase II